MSIKELPILFSSTMVCAILDDRKNQTRRVIKNQPSVKHKWQGWIIDSTDEKRECCASWGIGEGSLAYDLVTAKCPYRKIGDRLWVRETWHYDTDLDEYFYKADSDVNVKWKPSIHMPRLASRIMLEITNVRVERLNDISEEDAIAEGVEDKPAFIQLWQSINGQGSWNLNPWVWVVEFRRIN